MRVRELCVVLGLGLTACGGDDAPPKPEGATLSGDAIPFSKGPDGRISGATISILEMPERTLTTGDDGRFSFDGLKAGTEVTLRMNAEGFSPIQTGTFAIGTRDLERVTFQAVTTFEYLALAFSVAVNADPGRCQIVTTVTRIGKSIYDAGAHGEADVIVTVDPPVPAESQPIYFNSMVVPDRTLTKTSDDGGVVFVNVPPGVYTLTATKAGATFTQVKVKCEAGWLVNASPPWGLQRLQ